MASNVVSQAVTSRDTVSQWVERVTGYSSQYDADRWNAGQVIGEPKVYPNYGDRRGAWAMQNIDANQFIEVEFREAVYVTGIDIYETYHAGGVKAIKALGDQGQWRTLWQTDSVTSISSSRVFSPQLAEMSCRTKNIRVEVDCTACETWVEIDAIQLHGRTFLTVPPPPAEELASDFAKIVNDSTFSDCQFLLEGKHTVYAHKAIICARSDYFKAMFSEKSEKSYISAAIEIEDVSYISFMAVMQYLYTNSLPSNPYPCPPYDTVSLTHIWRVAERFQLAGLKTLTIYLISEKMDATNVVDTYLAAAESTPIIEEVRNNCILFMSTHLQSIVNTPSFTALPQDVMLEIIQGTTAKLKI
ncbi:TD and POZ domain-containing protein 2-like [Mercenaria mercenaria]|uniref:TD and POZ domain-containing protein 2-like n=1 Tax=Mercenaria mercenaria TaxID=6596 RepID=UPI00234EC293|nr:TD and POZ domain-containing protein 2-like [Mercenaria mercenaria]XP_045211209.2 TD and POZ domain-containing protein 2-like [Mercenaria mercenaria]XP_045211210.2 TD and POZ domain-containing protein 2-like [Mercenaria mercenaria]